MEAKIYLVRIGAQWWLFILVAISTLGIGDWISTLQEPQASATTILLISNARLIQDYLPSTFITLNLATSPQSQVLNPVQLNQISKYYPQLTPPYLQKNIQVVLDSHKQLLLIQFTDSSAIRAAAIVNYLARSFISTQKSRLHRQLDRYTSWLKQALSLLKTTTDRLQKTLYALTPRHKHIYKQTRAALQRTLHLVYLYQAALRDIQRTHKLIEQSYTILQPATPANTLINPSITRGSVLLISTSSGQILLFCILIGIEYRTRSIRHAGELEQITGTLPLLTMSARTLRDTKWLEQLQKLNKASKTNTSVVPGSTILLTSLGKQKDIAKDLACYLAGQGKQTLLILLAEKTISPTEPIKGVHLSARVDFSHIYTTSLPRLSVLTTHPYTPCPSINLLFVLPELQKMFDYILIAAPPIKDPEARLLATKATHTWLLVKQRRDCLKDLQDTHEFYQQRKLSLDYLLIM